MSIDPAFVIANHIEALLWTSLGVLALVKRAGPASLWLAGALISFGISDVIETRSGAWYRPAALLVLKVACVAVILLSGGLLLRRRGRR